MIYKMSHRIYSTVRGMQYIRYTSGTNLPEGVELNKWYKRAVDVTFVSTYGTGSESVTWEKAPRWFGALHPLTPYFEITGSKSGMETEPQTTARYDRYVQKIIIPLAVGKDGNNWFQEKYKNVLSKEQKFYIFTEEPYDWRHLSDHGKLIFKSSADENVAGEDIVYKPRQMGTSGRDGFYISTIDEELPAGTYTLYISNLKSIDGNMFRPAQIKLTFED